MGGRLKLLVAVALILVGGVALIGPAPHAVAAVVRAEQVEDRFERLGSFVRKTMAETAVPGVAVGVLYEGEAYTAGFGVTSVENRLEVTDQTLFQIGSITKTFTGTAIMRLVETGKLDLDATVRTYSAELQVTGRERRF